MVTGDTRQRRLAMAFGDGGRVEVPAFLPGRQAGPTCTGQTVWLNLPHLTGELRISEKFTCGDDGFGAGSEVCDI